jgi:hypothetical protein
VACRTPVALAREWQSGPRALPALDGGHAPTVPDSPRWNLRDSMFPWRVAVFGRRGEEVLRDHEDHAAARRHAPSTVWGAHWKRHLAIRSTDPEEYLAGADETSAHDGTILREGLRRGVLTVPLLGIEDPYSDCQNVSASDAYHAASDAAKSSFPTATTTSVPHWWWRARLNPATR